MDNISGVLNTVIKSLREITDPVKGADVGRLPVMFGPDCEDGDFTVPLGIIYAERFFSCVTPSLRYPLGISARAKDGQQPALELSRVAPAAAGEGNDIIPAWSADQAMTDTLFDALKLFKRPTPDAIRKYAGKDAAGFASALVDIITGKGRGALDGDSINWRCVYAGYIYLQVDEYLREKASAFALVPQNPAIHAMAKIALGAIDIDKKVKTAIVTFDDETKIRVSGAIAPPSPAAVMLNEILLSLCREKGEPNIDIHMRDLAEIKGLKTDKSSLAALQRDVRKQAEELNALSITFKDRENGKLITVGELRLNGGAYIVARNRIYWSYNPLFYANAVSKAPMDCPREMFKLNPNSTEFDLCWYICKNYRFNEGKKNGEKIYLRTLIAQTSHIPTYEKVMATNRNVRSRIIEKTFAALDKLQFLFYTVYDAKGTEVIYPNAMTWNTFKEAYILVDYSDFPDHPERIQAIQRRKKKRKQAAEKREAENAAKAAEKREAEKTAKGL